MAPGDSIRALFGGIVENWPSKCKHNASIALHMCGGSSSNGKVAERAAGRQSKNKDGTSLLGVAAQFGHLELAKWLGGARGRRRQDGLTIL